MKFSVVVGMQIAGPLDKLEGALDRVMEELVRLNTVDPSISLDLDKDQQVEVSLVVDADTPEEGVALGASTVRTALHAAEWHTLGWPTFNPRSVGAEMVDA